MTIKECIKKKGLQSEVAGFKRWQSVDVDFLTPNKLNDQVQFDIMFVGTKEGMNELSELFSDFCRENGFKTNTVQSVTVVQGADSYSELEYLTA